MDEITRGICEGEVLWDPPAHFIVGRGTRWREESGGLQRGATVVKLCQGLYQGNCWSLQTLPSTLPDLPADWRPRTGSIGCCHLLGKLFRSIIIALLNCAFTDSYKPSSQWKPPSPSFNNSDQTGGSPQEGRRAVITAFISQILHV